MTTYFTVEIQASNAEGTSIDDLARTIAKQHGIDSVEAAREAVTVHVDQISDDEDLYDRITNTLTPGGVELVTRAVAESYSVGAVATAAAQILVDLEDTVRQIGELTGRRDELVRAALRTELRRADIAAAAGFKGEARLYQIRDGRR